MEALAGRTFDRLSPLLNLDIPVTEEGMLYATNWVVLPAQATILLMAPVVVFLYLLFFFY